MKQSVVLLMDVRPTCTELARHLVLSGINLLIMNSNELVTVDDTQSDFLFAAQDIGHKVSTAL